MLTLNEGTHADLDLFFDPLDGEFCISFTITFEGEVIARVEYPTNMSVFDIAEDMYELAGTPMDEAMPMLRTLKKQASKAEGN